MSPASWRRPTTSSSVTSATPPILDTISSGSIPLSRHSSYHELNRWNAISFVQPSPALPPDVPPCVGRLAPPPVADRLAPQAMQKRASAEAAAPHCGQKRRNLAPHPVQNLAVSLLFLPHWPHLVISTPIHTLVPHSQRPANTTLDISNSLRKTTASRSSCCNHLPKRRPNRAFIPPDFVPA